MRTEPLPDIRQALAWRNLPDGLEEAAGQRKPVFCLAEPFWTNSVQRLALVLSKDEGLQALVGAAFIPVLLDPLEQPGVTACLRWASLVQTGTAGPPLLSLLTHQGLPFLSYPSMWPEGRETYPSLASLLRSVAERYSGESEAFLEESRQLQALVGEGISPHTSFKDFWQAVGGDLDAAHGGCQESPKHPQVPLLWLLLDACEEGDAAAREHLEKTLAGMIKGGIFDQLGGSFHRCARDERWVVPHFEKIAPINAGLAAVYARAAQVLDRPDFAKVARATIPFVQSCLENGVDALASNTHYYTWTAKEIQESLEPALIQAVGLHFKLTPDPSPLVLYRALEPDEMSAQSYEPAEVMAARLEQGKEALRFLRLQRPPPDVLQLGVPSWRAETLRWLFEASSYGLVAAESLLAPLKTLLEQRFEPSQGYLRGNEAWLEDQAFICAACLAAHRVTGEGLEAARKVADTILAAYVHPESGALLDQPQQQQQASQAVMDDLLPSPVGTGIDVLLELGGLCQEHRYLEAAALISSHYEPAARLLGCRGAGFWQAYFKMSRSS